MFLPYFWWFDADPLIGTGLCWEAGVFRKLLLLL
jgi:hypothetical protein